MVKWDIKDYTIEELLNYEKASSLIATYYANNIRIFSETKEELKENQAKFTEYNEMHSKIMSAIEEKLKTELS